MRPLVVLGDTFLDVDLEGSAERLCPEAPVPVLEVHQTWQRPGGAGLAALLAARSATRVVLVTALGTDAAGTRLGELLRGEVELLPLPLAGGTVCKTRARAAGQSMLRLDHGQGRAAERAPVPGLELALRTAGAVLVADYGRGVAAHPEIRRLLTEIAPRTPVVWDPHPRGSAPVRGARLATPNESEAAGFAPAEADQARALRHRWSCAAVAVTQGARGALLAGPGGGAARRVPVPADATVAAPARTDTCGAGDRFAAAAAAALLEGQSLSEAVAAAVGAAARFVGAGGAAALSVRADGGPHGTAPAGQAPRGETAFELVDRVRHAGGRVVATGGCFDLLHPGHLGLLRRARALGDALVVCVNSDDSVRRLKGPGRPIVPAADRARLLAELESVDAVVVFDEPSPAALLDRLRPDFWVKGGDYTGSELPEAAVLRRHGGEVVLVPLVGGYSTTGLLATAGEHG
ncbi:PfkB family carbohydrate kinase [Amycolatopsis aidingensis]|uniref:PfkB family carbohydrate kinase n=1 Tax=Amycolatopsis aidingensis TaxID=2842453 RepID=UPI001C0D5F8E|nr:PfkB family carbohydrate kinase [Amycolatopsis aidingensis]